MGYSVQTVSKSKKTARPKTPSSYKGALEGFTSSINDIRKQLLSDQAAMIDYEIEVGTASISDKISLYEQYLNTLVQGTTEWVRVANKLQTLEDQADSVDFSLVKKLYQTNQVDTEFYYQVLKERATVPNLSQQEKQTRLLELASFEKDVREKNTDQAIRDSALQQSLGLITAADRYALLEMAVQNETDPDRKRSLQIQLVNQAKEVRNEDITLKELYVRKGIQEGTASKRDLLPIVALRLQTALTPEEALKSEIEYQNLLESINNEDIALAKKGSASITTQVKSAIGQLDREIEMAKKNGELTRLSLLYTQKTALIGDFWNSDAVTVEDKDQSSFKQYFKNVLGQEITGNFEDMVGKTPKQLRAEGFIMEVAPTDDFNLQRVTQAVTNPGSSALVKTFNPDTKAASYELVNGTLNPDGTYSFGNQNVVVGTKELQVQTPISGPTLDGKVQYSESTLNIPDARKIEQIPNYAGFVGQANQTPFSENELKGAVTVENMPVKNKDGTITYTPIRQYIFEGDRFKDYAGFEPVPGSPGKFTFISPDGTLPTQEMLQKKPEALSIPTQIGAAVQNIFKIPTISGLRADVKQVTSSNQLSQAMPTFSLPQVNVPQFQLPDFGAMFNQTTQSIGSQLLRSGFNPIALGKSVVQTGYNQALQSGANTVMQNEKVSGIIPTVTSKVQEFAGNIANNVRSTFNNIWRF